MPIPLCRHFFYWIMMRLQIAWVVILGFLMGSCLPSDRNVLRIPDKELPPIEVELHRYGKALFELDTNNLQQELKGIQPAFPYFLDANLDEEENLAQIRSFVCDTQLIHIYNKSMEVFPDLNKLQQEINQGFRHFKYHFPAWEPPLVYTYISGLFYENPVIVADSVMVIAIDVYLGKDFLPYRSLGLPNYKLQWMVPESIVVDVMETLYNTQLAKPQRSNTLLEKMVDGGKFIYYLDAMLPDTPDSLKMSYTKKQLDWVQLHEKDIWAFLIKNNLLYATNSKSHARLLQDGPFTVGFGNDSPARIGIWVGWQIVADFMAAHPEVSLEELLSITDAQELLKQSEYKP